MFPHLWLAQDACARDACSSTIDLWGFSKELAAGQAASDRCAKQVA